MIQPIPDKKDPKDKTDRVLEEIQKWKRLKTKGSILLHFDGSGRIPRFTITFEGV